MSGTTSTTTTTAPTATPRANSVQMYGLADNGRLVGWRAKTVVELKGQSAAQLRAILAQHHADALRARPGSESRTMRGVGYPVVLVRGGKGVVVVQVRDPKGLQTQVKQATLSETQLTLCKSVWAQQGSPVDVAAIRAARQPAPRPTASPKA